MRTSKWLITASLLITMGAVAQQTAAPSPETRTLRRRHLQRRLRVRRRQPT